MQIISSSQAWSILKRHARDEIEPFRLHELCKDQDRVSAFITVLNSTTETDTRDNTTTNETRRIILDLSRQRMTVETVNNLYKLATARHLNKFIHALAWGQAPSMHLSLRFCSASSYMGDDPNVTAAVHLEWDRMERLSNSIRAGQLRGVTGSTFKSVVVIGRGVAVAGLQFIDCALRRDETAVRASSLSESTASRIQQQVFKLLHSVADQTRSLTFLTSVDPIAAAKALANLDPASTLVVSVALNGNEETGLATKVVKSWLLHALGIYNTNTNNNNNRRAADHVLSHHMLLVTGNDRVISAINKPERVHIVPRHSRCEAFTTFAAMLPLAIVYGWPIVHAIIQGAHDMDKHFVETNPRHNLPVLLALTDVWNDTLLGATARVMTPWTEALAGYPQFVAAVESQTCSRRSQQDTVSCSSVVVDGRLDGVSDRACYQSMNVMNTELIMTLDSQVRFNTSKTLVGAEEVNGVQDSLMCSLFGHADELAFGCHAQSSDAAADESTGSPNRKNSESNNELQGNRPSTLIMVSKLDAFSCGQLVALAEHRAIVKAHICGLDPFVLEPGTSIRMYRTDLLKESLQEMLISGADDSDEEDAHADGQINQATKILLGNYASHVVLQRSNDQE